MKTSEMPAMQYRSTATLLGLPLVHIHTGSVVNGRYERGVARGWIAIGDIAFGVLLGLGGLSFGLISIGGGAAGLIAVGGGAVGGFAVGGFGLGIVAVAGMALGVLAVGGLAVGGLAVGGVAIAHSFAVGGLAIAENANNPAAREAMQATLVEFGRSIGSQLVWLGPVLVLLSLLPAMGGAVWSSTPDTTPDAAD